MGKIIKAMTCADDKEKKYYRKKLEISCTKFFKEEIESWNSCGDFDF